MFFLSTFPVSNQMKSAEDHDSNTLEPIPFKSGHNDSNSFESDDVNDMLDAVGVVKQSVNSIEPIKAFAELRKGADESEESDESSIQKKMNSTIGMGFETSLDLSFPKMTTDSKKRHFSTPSTKEATDSTSMTTETINANVRNCKKPGIGFHNDLFSLSTDCDQTQFSTSSAKETTNSTVNTTETTNANVSNCKKQVTDFNSELFALPISTNLSSKVVSFKPFQSGMWNDRFNDLKQFQKTYGHCCVPSKWAHNPSLAQWVKRQRHQYKLKRSGKRSTMSEPREKALEQLGFIWNSQEAVWETRFNELDNFRQIHGHCMVPTQYPEDPQLAVWTKFQRRQMKLFFTGKQSSLTQERARKLVDLGVIWKDRQPKSKSLVGHK